MNKILITPRSLTKNGHPALEKFTQAGFDVLFSTPGVQPTQDELLNLLPQCVGYLAGVEKIDAPVLEAAKHLKAISRNGVGINNINLDAAQRLNIKILITPGANSRGVAELAFAHILAAVRAIPFSDSTLKNADWQRRKGIELQGKTLGLIGCGHIGQIVAQFALAFDMTVLAYDPYKDESFKPAGSFSYCPLNQLLQSADIISLHCPPAKDGKPIINTQTLSIVKNGLYLINTARAELIDDNAAAEALEQGKLTALTMDVFPTEPPQNLQLVKNSRVIATPHIGGFTQESVDRSVTMAVDNLIQAVNQR